MTGSVTNLEVLSLAKKYKLGEITKQQLIEKLSQIAKTRSEKLQRKGGSEHISEENQTENEEVGLEESSIPTPDKTGTFRGGSMSLDERKRLLEQLVANKKQFLQKYQDR